MSSSQFFCHACQQIVALRNQDLVCDLCGGEFVQQLAQGSTSPPAMDGDTGSADVSTNSTASSSSSNHGDSSSSDTDGSGGATAVDIEVSGSGRASPVQNSGFWPVGGADNVLEIHINGVLRRVDEQRPRARERVLRPNERNTMLDGLTTLNEYILGELQAVVTRLVNQEETVNVAVDRRFLRIIPIVLVDQPIVERGTACSICMEQFTEGERVAQLNCEHIFHRRCILPWLGRCNTCPICRQKVDPTAWTRRKPPTRRPTHPDNDHSLLK